LREIFLYHLVRFVVVYGTGYGEKIKWQKCAEGLGEIIEIF
jgi:hypothetical protein